MELEKIGLTFAPILKKGGAQRALVFGSYARGEADEFSDLDLVIIAETQKPFLERYRDFGELFLKFPRALEVFVYTPQEFEKMRAEENPLVCKVLEEGKVIYEG